MWRKVKAFQELGFYEGGERGASCWEGAYQLLPHESRLTNPEVKSESVSHSVMSDSLRPRIKTVACQDHLSMEFSRQQYWSG